MKSKALCGIYNGHAALRLEQTVLEYLGQYSDPEMVRQKLSAARNQEITEKSESLKKVERSLVELEGQFLKHLDLLKRGVVNEKEFSTANEHIRGNVEALQAKKEELAGWLNKQQRKTEAVRDIPTAVGSFLVDFQSMDIRKQKSQLQTLLKAIHVYRDDRLELEFRT